MPIHVHPYQQDKWDFGPAFEGALRPHMIVQNGRVRESAFFSITKDDSSTVKRQLQQRLDRRIPSTG